MNNHEAKFGVFGEIVYLSILKLQVECLLCGDYHQVKNWPGSPSYDIKYFSEHQEIPFDTPYYKVHCENLNKEFVILHIEGDKNNSWAAFSLFWLFDCENGLNEVDRFYLPRDWNPKGEWVSRLELELKYLQYKLSKPLRFLYLYARHKLGV